MRAEFSCQSWNDDGDEIEITETGDLDVGEDTYWLIITTAVSDGQTIQVGFGFSQIGDTFSAIGYGAEDSIDPDLFGALMALGAEKVVAGRPE